MTSVRKTMDCDADSEAGLAYFGASADLGDATVDGLYPSCCSRVDNSLAEVVDSASAFTEVLGDGVESSVLVVDNMGGPDGTCMPGGIVSNDHLMLV